MDLGARLLFFGLTRLEWFLLKRVSRVCCGSRAPTQSKLGCMQRNPISHRRKHYHDKHDAVVAWFPVIIPRNSCNKIIFSSRFRVAHMQKKVWHSLTWRNSRVLQEINDCYTAPWLGLRSIVVRYETQLALVDGIALLWRHQRERLQLKDAGCWRRGMEANSLLKEAVS